MTSTDGYPAITKFMACDPDSETVVVRKFSSLAANILLQQQAELTELEGHLERLRLRALENNDWKFSMAMQSRSRMLESAHSNDAIKEYVDVLDRVENVLQKYQETILRQAEVAKLERPRERVLAAYRRELHGSKGVQNGCTKLLDDEGTILDDEQDLVALRTLPQKDLLSRMVREYWPFSTTSMTSSSRHFEDRLVLLVAGIINTIIAALLLVGSILCLYFVSDPKAQLGSMLGFIILFAVGISICTGASRDSIFAATAAYSAVLIVFVSGNLGNTNTNAVSR